MEFLLERQVRLNSQPQYASLYQWALNEIDAQGQTGHDQIPWPWTLRFTATSCLISDSIEIRPGYKTPPETEIARRQVILFELRPGDLKDDQTFIRNTTYSMFGTDRTIKSFQLQVDQIGEADEEHCSAWGTVAYTSEHDFRQETTDDCIVFYLRVKPDTFARYMDRLTSGLADEIIFSVGRVEGFYSEWSPTVSADRVKVLANGSEHKVIVPSGVEIEPPRLGAVGGAALYINRELKFVPPAVPADEDDDDSSGMFPVAPEALAPRPADPQLLKALGAVRQAAWWIVVALMLLFVTMVFKG